MKRVELFYDVMSPFSWLAFEVLCRYQSRWMINLKLKPALLAGIREAADNRASGLPALKLAYEKHDLKRTRTYFNVPINMPKSVWKFMQKGSLPAQRFITALDITDPHFTEELSRQLWMRGLSQGMDITEDSTLISAAKSTGIDELLIQDALQRMKEQPVKDRLKEYTQQASNHGAFGLPTIVAHVNGKPEVFFGSDRFEILAHTLGEKWEGPLPELSKCKL